MTNKRKTSENLITNLNQGDLNYNDDDKSKIKTVLQSRFSDIREEDESSKMSSLKNSTFNNNFHRSSSLKESIKRINTIEAENPIKAAAHIFKEENISEENTSVIEIKEMNESPGTETRTPEKTETRILVESKVEDLSKNNSPFVKDDENTSIFKARI